MDTLASMGVAASVDPALLGVVEFASQE